ncbi:MAG TPA: hypothetical protein VGK65_09860 [Candidatus Binatia bacterium]|jgi:acetate kinase
MKILVLNCGSSTLKFQLIETGSVKDEERKLARGIVDRIGKKASYRFEAMGAVLEKTAVIPTHEEAVRLIYRLAAVETRARFHRRRRPPRGARRG